jgi:hypothetical protein
MTGGVQLDHIVLLSDDMERRNHNPKNLANDVFATGHITIKNGKTFSCITKISKKLKTELDSIKDTENIIEYEETKITYVGKIIGGGRTNDGFTGTNYIWIQLKNKIVHYIVEIQRIRNDDIRTSEKLLYIALKSLCNIQNIDLLISALHRIKVKYNLNFNNESIKLLIKINDEISTIQQHLTNLQKQKLSLYTNNTDINKIDWTFTLYK